jgi:hypothetical protein
MSYFIKVSASRLKQCPNNNFFKNGSLKIYHFLKTCNLKILYLVFGNDVSLRLLIF